MSNLHEKWLTIQIAPIYQISSFGRVRNTITNKIIKGTRDYLNGNPHRIRITLKTSLNKIIHTKIHRLMIPFLPKRQSIKDTIDHINRNPFDNRIENLRWASQSQQCRNSSRYKMKRKISAEEIDIMFKKRKTYTISDIAKQHGIPPNVVWTLLTYIHKEY
jgi:hypothetical protein